MTANTRHLHAAQFEKEEVHLLSHKEEGSEDGLYIHHSTSQRPSTATFFHLFILLLLTNLICISSTYWFAESHFKRTFSPDFAGTERLFPGLDRSFSLVEFSDHVVNKTSRWTAPPSKEVDHAWGELGAHDKGFLLPGKAGREYGLDPRRHLYAPPGTMLEGEDGFPVFIQGLHDLHCLNALRRNLYFNKDYYRQYENETLVPEFFRRSHINHCLDNIRERLMCTADAGIIPLVYTSRDENWLQFGTQHKCHSYEALLEWNRNWHRTERERSVNWTVPLLAPDDAVFFTEV